MTASAFTLTLTIPAEGFAVTSGEPVIGGMHGATRHNFCPRCKSWMFTRPEGMDAFVNLRATMLDDHGWVAPYIEVWTRDKVPWASTPATHSFETEPEFAAYEAFVEEFAATGARPD